MSETLIGLVPDNWQLTTLGDLCRSGGGDIQTGPFGSQLHASDYVSVGIPSVMPQNIGDNVIVEDGIARITPEDASRLSRYLLGEGDIVYSRRGDVERRALVRFEQDGWLCGTGCLRVRLGDSANSRFISYYLGHPEVREWIVRHAVGATMPNLNTGILSNVPTVLPPNEVQLAIAEVLGALDDKIAVNERIATTERELGIALFRRAVEADRAEEPEIGTLTELVSRGVAPKYSEDESELLILNQKCIRSGRVTLAPARRTLAAKVPSTKRLKTNDVLVNSTGVGTLGRVARWTGGQEATVDSHVTIVRFDLAKVNPVCGGFAMLAAQPEIERLGEGSTGQTELSRMKLGSLPLRVPSREIQDSLGRRLDVLESRGEAALTESQALAELRDALLPGLMSGAIRVRDAEKAVEDAT